VAATLTPTLPMCGAEAPEVRLTGSAPQSGPRAAPVTVAGRRVFPTPVFDTYWRFADARQELYFARLVGQQRPWTSDPVLAEHRFTNAYRAADRVSQYLIRHVIYGQVDDPVDIVFRTLLFKFFNRIETWQALVSAVGEPRWSDYRFSDYEHALSRLRESGARVYNAAYVIPPPQLGEGKKHRNHLRLAELMMRDRLPERLAECRSMREAFTLLRSYPSVGDFLAYQFLIDLNYAEVVDFDEMEFVVPGPGARDGIRKCFGKSADGIEADLIRWMADNQESQFERLGLEFRTLWGRPLQLIDAQNLFCEVDKYARVTHPDVQGISGRTRIKQTYRAGAPMLEPWFPPKWRINERIEPRRETESIGNERPMSQLSLI
jgi:hypothetical protein